MRALCDTNILIDLLSSLRQASREMEKYEELFLSRITWMEVLVAAPDQATDELWRRLRTIF
jgi:predicted nucleic acid-binding protein